jgi:hypothetical protein
MEAMGSLICLAGYPGVVTGVCFFSGLGVFISAFGILVFSSPSWCFYWLGVASLEPSAYFCFTSVVL